MANFHFNIHSYVFHYYNIFTTREKRRKDIFTHRVQQETERDREREKENAKIGLKMFVTHTHPHTPGNEDG